MGMPGHMLTLSREGLDEFYKKPHFSKKAVECKLAAVEEQLAQFRDFVPWPALIESFATDASKLQSIYDRMT